MRKIVLSFIVVALQVLALTVHAKTVHYELKITKGSVNLSGHRAVDFALQVNGGIPAPTLEFTEGDDAEIVVTNAIPDEETSVHWHRILLPPEMDGVPYVTTPPIHPGETFTFRFKIRQHGTYWYHSHTMVQEQKGVFGAIVIHPKTKTIKADRDVVVVLSDWSEDDPDQIGRNLRKDGNYYLYKKNAVRSWAGAIAQGSFGNYIDNEWTRMGGMDLSDIGYDAFLINGKRDSQLAVAHPGEKIRLRLINAAASTYFSVSLGQAPMQVISADGVDVEPIAAKQILMGMAETYDVLFEVPEHKNFELRATSQDGTGHASGWIGMGEKVAAPDLPMPDLYSTMDHSAMNHSAMNHADVDPSPAHHGSHHDEHAGHSMPTPAKELSGPVVEQLTVDALRAKESTMLPAKAPRYDLTLKLGGDMERYIWHLNGKAIYQDRTIEIREGDVVRFTFQNETMMHHPMHLHGHFFRVLNSAAEKSPLKHTVDVPPHGSRTIEFYANEPGEWMLHCHNLYHMNNGMARVVKYLSYTPRPEIAAHQHHDHHLHNDLYYTGMVELATNHGQVALRTSRTWDELDLHFETRKYESFDHIEGDAFYRQWQSNYMNLFLGATHFSEFEETKTRGVVGVGYMLPMLIESDFVLDHTGKTRLDLAKRFQWSSAIYSEAKVSFRQQARTQFEVSLMYARVWDWSVGLMFTEDTAGAGAQYRF